MLFSILKSFLALGLPTFLMTWYLFRRLYERGELQAGIDKEERSKQLKSIKKQKSGRDNLLHRNWMKFGGGFYGTTAATTLVCIEVLDMWQFVWHFPGWATLFEDGPVALLVGLLVNQIQNFIQAALWFTYWGQHDGSLLLWVAAAYISYLLGLRAAGKPFSEWQADISMWWERRA